MLPPNVPYTSIGSPVGASAQMMNPLAQRMAMGQGATGGAGVTGQPAGLTGNLTGGMGMNVQHPVAQLQQPGRPGGAAPQQSPMQGMQQAMGGLQKMMGGQKPGGAQPNPSQGQTASSGINKPTMPLQGNPTMGDTATAQMNPNGQPGAVGGMGPVQTPSSSPANAGGGLLGVGGNFDPSLQGASLNPSTMTGMDLNMVDPSQAASMSTDMSGFGGGFGGLLGLF
jgi:hypothetical protein